MPSYDTHTGLRIAWETSGQTHFVYIEGASKKPLYLGNSRAEAEATYREAAAHYEERKAARDDPERDERDVEFTPRQTPEAKRFVQQERLKRRGEIG